MECEFVCSVVIYFAMHLLYSQIYKRVWAEINYCGKYFLGVECGITIRV